MIYVNARFLTQRITGVQRFALEICKQLKKIRQDVVFVAPKNIKHKADAEALDVITYGSTSGHIWEQFSLPRLLKKEGNPLLLNLANTAPLLYPNQIVTVHDLAFKINPKWFSRSFSYYYNFLVPKILKNSKGVITVSRSSKIEIAHIYDIDERKITVIYNAVSQSFFDTTLDTGSTYKHKPYILAVASQDPRKNLSRLVEAFKMVDDSTKLLLVGGRNANFATHEFSTKGVNRIESLGYVTDVELAELYSNAEIFVYPSLYEGFGLPNIEAMHYGCPVITSDIPACREVCEKAALYVDPTNINKIAENINQLLKDKSLRQELSQLSLLQTRKYSWVESANNLSNLLDELLMNSQSIRF